MEDMEHFVEFTDSCNFYPLKGIKYNAEKGEIGQAKGEIGHWRSVLLIFRNGRQCLVHRAQARIQKLSMRKTVLLTPYVEHCEQSIVNMMTSERTEAMADTTAKKRLKTSSK